MEPTFPASLREKTERQNENANLIRLHAKMVKSARSWGAWLLVFGAMQLVASNLLHPSNSILLLIAGALSFVFTHPSLFVLYVTTLALAAASNIIGAIGGGQASWAVFALVQLCMAYSTMREYLAYRRSEAAYQDMLRNDGGTETRERVPLQVFPISGCALAVVAGLLLVALLVVSFVLATQEVQHLPEWGKWLFGLARSFAVLAVGLSVASLASRFRYQILSILALAGSALTVLILILLTLVKS